MKQQGDFTMLKLLDLSGKIDPSTVELYERLDRITATIGVPFFLVGATARDSIMEVGFSIHSARATNDVDIALRVSGWDEFNRLKHALLDSGEFADAREAQRLIYRNGLSVDFIPFGGTTDSDGRLSWPPSHDFVMSTVGFEEASQAAQLVRVRARPPLDIRVASPAGLAILKIIAWADRPLERERDAYDLAFIMENYLDAGNYERLIEEHPDLVKVEDFDYTKAGCRLLGRDIASIASRETRGRIKETLEGETTETGRYRLVRQIVQRSTLTGGEGQRFEDILAFLNELRTGIDEGQTQ